MKKRADTLRVGEIAKFGVHVSPVVRIIRESPRVLLIHIESQRHNSLPWVYRVRAGTLVETFTEPGRV